AWIDWPGHIWADRWNQGAVYSPDGATIQFDRGTVWQRDLGPAAIPVRPGRRGARLEVPPEPAAPPVERQALARTAFDGSWSVVIKTENGPCDPQYRFGVQIINGNVVYEGGGPANVQGQVGRNGSVWVSVSSGGQSATGSGRLSRNTGGGSWRGQGAAGSCAGSWQAA